MSSTVVVTRKFEPNEQPSTSMEKRSASPEIREKPGAAADESGEPGIACNWALIDEISIPLLESGVCTFPILQAVLPSILLMDSKEEKVVENLPKLFRIAQMEIEHLLKSQNEMLRQLAAFQSEAAATKLLRGLQNDKTAPIYECATCKKTFVSSSFLESHLKRRHQKKPWP